jgi:hypothetical protein
MEYIFFDAGLRDRFAAYAKGLSVGCELQDDNMGMLVLVPDELSDELMNALEDRYEELQDEQSQMMSQIEGGFTSLAGFSLVLPDGSTSTVPLLPDIANRLLSNFTIDEIQALFSTVARCALEPGEKHLCKILHGEESAT